MKLYQILEMFAITSSLFLTSFKPSSHLKLIELEILGKRVNCELYTNPYFNYALSMQTSLSSYLQKKGSQTDQEYVRSMKQEIKRNFILAEKEDEVTNFGKEVPYGITNWNQTK